LTEHVVQEFVARVARRANLRTTGPHMLRHTFCSHLAMRGAPAHAIQELAGHRELSTTQQYMDLSPSAVESAIRLLEPPAPAPTFRDMLETGDQEKAKS
jgi:site-specific recombinase XerD